MRWLFAVALVVGIGLLIVTLVTDARRQVRSIAGGATAFGIAGLSAAFAGWGEVLALVAAVAAAAVFAWYAGREAP